MINQSVEEKVKQFVSQLNLQWNDLVIEYSYDAQEDVWDICHFDHRLQYNDLGFQKSVGELIRTLFFEHGIFNISFGYKHVSENHTFTSTGYTSVEMSAIVGDSVNSKWFSCSPIKNTPSPEGMIISSSIGYSVHSDFLCSYNFDPGMTGKMGKLKVNEGTEVLAA